MPQISLFLRHAELLKGNFDFSASVRQCVSAEGSSLLRISGAGLPAKMREPADIGASAPDRILCSEKKEGVMKQYLALYRENRPETFSQVLGQEHIVKILRHQIATDTVAHAYLFCGTRGTGKTTMARILAKAVNCTGESGEKPCGVCDTCRDIAAGRYVDVVEIDAASNNGVEDVRDLRESVNYPPVVGRKKVYIIDEVHMMTTNAFNAFLKTLEEPPADVIFILATTDPEKLPPTVLSRCMRLDFKRVSGREIRENMRRICAAHGVEITEDALALLAMNADGSVRDSLSLLEQCMSCLLYTSPSPRD